MGWKDVKAVLRPQSVRMGSMKMAEEIGAECEPCIQNCITRAWEMEDNGFWKTESNPLEIKLPTH